MSERANGKSAGRFGTFGGVFTPTVLTILGLILFLRVGWVVGQAGLIRALVIILLANLISCITGLSVASIATNMHVRAGGPYYMITRTLGLEIGAAIGIPLYLSQAVSVAFYIIGFTEALGSIVPVSHSAIVSTGLILIFGCLAFIGADFIIKVQYIILAVMGAALVSFFLGGWNSGGTIHWNPAAGSTADFWTIFAVFFPAVTGIMVGVSMSGDLKDPARNIPRGVLWAILVTALIYLAAAIKLGIHAPGDALLSDNMIMQKMARWPFLILLGVWASTLSSALGSILAAPRTLEAIARDRALPPALGVRMGSATEPRLAVIVTTLISIVIVWMGNINFVAPIITMFFLNTYGMINLTAGLERLIGNPSYRPTFNTPWYVSLAGAFGCYGAMFLINATATLIAILVSYGIFVLLERRSLKQNWGDIRSGIWFAVARFGLIRMEQEPNHVKNWRPNIIVFTSMPHRREQLLEMGSWLVVGRGIVTFYHVLVGNIGELSERGLRAASMRIAQEYLSERGITAFAECSIAEDFYPAVVDIAQSHGIAGLEPNTVVLGWGKEPDIQAEQIRLVSTLMALHKNTLLLHYDPEADFGRKRLIDIWWRGRDRNADLMLLLAHIITRSRPWDGAKIRIIRLMASEEGVDGTKAYMAEFLKSVRVEAEPLVLTPRDPDEPFISVMERVGVNTDLVLIGLKLPSGSNYEAQAAQVNRILPGRGSAILVRSAEVEDILYAENNQSILLRRIDKLRLQRMPRSNMTTEKWLLKFIPKIQERKSDRFGKSPIMVPGSAPGTLTVETAESAPPILVMAYHEDNFQEAAIKDVGDLASWLENWPVVWIHIPKIGQQSQITQIADLLGLHALALEDVLASGHRPKMEQYSNYLFFILQMAANGIQVPMSQMGMFLGRNFVVTCSEKDWDCLEPVRRRIRDGVGRIRKRGSDYLGYAVIDAVVDHYYPLLEDYGERLEELEEMVVSSPNSGLLSDIHEVKHGLLMLRRNLWPMRELVGRLLDEDIELIEPGTRGFIRDCHDHVIHAVDLVALYREISASLSDMYLSSLSNKLNEIMRILTLISTIFIPLTFIVGVYGMNFNTEKSRWNMPELNWAFGYLAVILVMVLIAIGMVIYFKRKKWL